MTDFWQTSSGRQCVQNRVPQGFVHQDLAVPRRARSVIRLTSFDRAFLSVVGSTASRSGLVAIRYGITPSVEMNSAINSAHRIEIVVCRLSPPVDVHGTQLTTGSSLDDADRYGARSRECRPMLVQCSFKDSVTFLCQRAIFDSR